MPFTELSTYSTRKTTPTETRTRSSVRSLPPHLQLASLFASSLPFHNSARPRFKRIRTLLYVYEYGGLYYSYTYLLYATYTVVLYQKKHAFAERPVRRRISWRRSSSRSANGLLLTADGKLVGRGRRNPQPL
jgi:hypothetical protein